MLAKNDTLLNNNWKRVLFVLFAFVMLYVISYIINPFSKLWTHYQVLSWADVLPEMLIALCFCFFISESSIYINQKFNSLLPWTEHPAWRAILQTAAHILNTSLLIFLQFSICYLVFDDYQEELTNEGLTAIWQLTISSFFISLMISTINTVSYLIANWKRTAVEAAQHKQAAAEAEVQALKLQVDPHFVFNNLSVLSEIILSDQQLGYDYAENFTKVYRYLLLNSRKDLITLEEELRFLNAYSFLISNRIGQGIRFEFNTDMALMGLQLPPLTMQILIENAMSNNKTLKDSPLQIHIYTNENNDLIFSNTVAPLSDEGISLDVKMSHILERHRLWSDRAASICQDENSFTMIIPLITNQHKAH